MNELDEFPKTKQLLKCILAKKNDSLDDVISCVLATLFAYL